MNQEQKTDIDLLDMFYEQFDTQQQMEILNELEEDEEVIDYMRKHYGQGKEK